MLNIYCTISSSIFLVRRIRYPSWSIAHRFFNTRMYKRDFFQLFSELFFLCVIASSLFSFISNSDFIYVWGSHSFLALMRQPCILSIRIEWNHLKWHRLMYINVAFFKKLFHLIWFNYSASFKKAQTRRRVEGITASPFVFLWMR